MFWAPVFFTLASVLSLFFYHLDIGFEVAGRQEHIPVMPININPSLYGVPGATPIWKRGEEPLPPGLTEEDRPMFEEQQKWGRYAGMAMESCAVKTVLAGGAGAYCKLGFITLLSDPRGLFHFGAVAFRFWYRCLLLSDVCFVRV